MTREHLGQPQVNRAQNGADPFTLARIQRIETERERKKVSLGTLARAAGMKERTWSRIRSGRQVPQRETLQKVADTLAQIPVQLVAPERLVAGVYRGALALLAREHGITIEAIEATDFSVQRSQDKAWRLANRCRQMAICLVAIEYEVSGATIGAIAGVSKMAVSKTLGTVEDWRDDEATDQLLDRIRAIVAPELRG